MDFFKFFTFLLLTKCSKGFGSLVTQKAAQVARTVFKEFTTCVVWCNDDKQDEVTEFIKLFQGDIVLFTAQVNETNNKAIRQYNKSKNNKHVVYFAANIYEFEYVLSLLYQDLVISIRLIVVLTNPYSYTELSQFMNIAWKNDIVDILVMSYDLQNQKNVLLTTYFPYKDGKCNNFTPVILKEKTKMFFPKKFINFQLCEIRTTMIQMSPYSRLKFENKTLVSISGIDGNLLLILFDKLNATMKVYSDKDHGGLGTIINGTATGAFADLITKQADILLPGLFMSAIRYPHAQFSHPYAAVIIMWLGPRQRKISEWIRILQPFMSQITPAILLTAFAFVVITIIVRRYGFHRYFSSNGIIFQTFVIFLGIAVDFETRSIHLNSLFMLWIWFCTIVRIVYQSVLVDGLQRTVFESPLRTFETAVNLVDGYGGIVTVGDLFNGTEYYKKFTVIPHKSIPAYLKAIEAGKRFLVATDMTLALDTAPNIQVLSESPITSSPLSFVMRPGWPAFPEINELILRMIESGFVQKVIRDYHWEWVKAVETKENRDAKPLTLDILIGCFYGLAVMYGICTLVFIFEIVYYKMTQSKNKII